MESKYGGEFVENNVYVYLLFTVGTEIILHFQFTRSSIVLILALHIVSRFLDYMMQCVLCIIASSSCTYSVHCLLHWFKVFLHHVCIDFWRVCTFSYSILFPSVSLSEACIRGRPGGKWTSCRLMLGHSVLSAFCHSNACLPVEEV